MKYVITLSLECTYELDGDMPQELAEQQALEWFAEAKPHMTIQRLAPCQLGEKCSYPSTHHCSDCQ